MMHISVNMSNDKDNNDVKNNTTTATNEIRSNKKGISKSSSMERLSSSRKQNHQGVAAGNKEQQQQLPTGMNHHHHGQQQQQQQNVHNNNQHQQRKYPRRKSLLNKIINKIGKVAIGNNMIDGDPAVIEQSRDVDISEITVSIPTSLAVPPRRRGSNQSREEIEEEIKTRMSTILGDSPQDYLDHVLEERGYSVKRYDTLKSAYYNEPTELQQSCYGVRILEMIDRSDEEGLESCLLAGIHTNPCNEYGESVLHKVCRAGNMALLDILLDQGCNVQCADDFGRTPLHEACRNVDFNSNVIETLMMHDIHLFYMVDAHGRTPLQYVDPELWYDWLLFLETRIDRYWPTLRNKQNNQEGEVDQSSSSSSPPPNVPPLTLQLPNSRPAKDPENALSTELAWMVGSGVVEPEEAVSYMDESVLRKFLPSIHNRLNEMAKEEELKEKLHHQHKFTNDVNHDDLTL